MQEDSDQVASSVVDELFDRVEKTSKVRFVSERRLALHQRLSQWVVALMSLGLIFIPACGVFGLDFKYDQRVLEAIELLLAVSVLVYSLLLSLENFSLRAARMHDCGVALTCLARRLEAYKSQAVLRGQYEKFVLEYKMILDRYENHAYLDYLILRSQKRKIFGEGWRGYLKFSLAWLGARIRFVLHMAHYLLPFVILVSIFLGMFR